MRRVGIAVAVLSGIVGARVLHAQNAAPPAVTIVAPPAAHSVAQMADSIAASGDTVRAVAMLEAALKQQKLDAAAWHQLGLINWSMARSVRSGSYISSQQAIKQLRVADSAFRLATQFAPDSGRYWVSLARFLLGSRVSFTRLAAQGHVQRGFDAAKASGDFFALGAAADEIGMEAWRSYEGVANRGIPVAGQQVRPEPVSFWRRDRAKEFLEQVAQKITPPTGGAAYDRALDHFRQAVNADPYTQRYSRHLFMAYATKQRWDELLDVANKQSARFPLDFQSQLARGLALHRLRRSEPAAAAFDSAFALMGDRDRGRMTRLSRVLRPKPSKVSKGTIGDSIAYTALEEPKQRGLEASYWFLSDPLALTPANEVRLEFLSRVVFAEFRWTDDDVDLHGADTDRGNIYVRYGPPDDEMTIGAGAREMGPATLIWGYNTGLTFFFTLNSFFGTAQIDFNDRDWVDELQRALPVTWNNLPLINSVDTIPLRVARFRATGDSLDAVVTASVGLDSLTRGLDVDAIAVQVGMRMLDQYVRPRIIDTSRVLVTPGDSVGRLDKNWTTRVGPGVQLLRLEAYEPESGRVARASTRLEGMPAVGFAISDVLLGSVPTAKDNTRPPARWTDVTITANTGDFEIGSRIGLLWEMYDLAERDGSATYRLNLRVTRVEGSGSLRAAARAFDNLGRALGRTSSSRRGLTITFERTVAAAPVLVEYLSLDMADAAPGRYRLQVEVVDLATKRVTTRDTEFRIR